MIQKELILKDPLGFLGFDQDKKGGRGEFGAVASRAGVGKTAFLVQIAISNLLRDKRVLHVSLKDPVDKVQLWYQELFYHLTRSHDPAASRHLLESLLTRRFIMTFETESFDFEKLISRMESLKSQRIFTPQMLILDGLSADAPIGPGLARLKSHAVAENLTMWFSIRTHRHQTEGAATILGRMCGEEHPDLFDMIIHLLPENDHILVKRVDKNGGATHPALILDPSSMMIKETISA